MDSYECALCITTGIIRKRLVRQLCLSGRWWRHYEFSSDFIWIRAWWWCDVHSVLFMRFPGYSDFFSLLSVHLTAWLLLIQSVTSNSTFLGNSASYIGLGGSNTKANAVSAASFLGGGAIALFTQETTGSAVHLFWMLLLMFNLRI